MGNKVLIITDRESGTKSSAHFVAPEISRQGGQYVFLSIADLLAKKDSLSLLYNKGTCTINFYKRGRSINLKKEIKSVLFWRPQKFRESEAYKKLDKSEYDFFVNEWRVFLRGIYFSLKDCFWLNPYPHNLQFQEKAYQLQLAQSLGFKIPFSFMTTSLKQARSLFKNTKDAIVYKTFGSSIIERKDRHGKKELLQLFTTKINKKNLRNFETEYVIPNIFQRYVPKKKELRITIVGRAVFAAEIDSQTMEASQHDWRKGIFVLPFCKHSLPSSMGYKCFRLMRKLGLNYCTIDMILTPKNEYVFLEVNPNGQYGWVEGMTKQPITKNIARMLIKGTINYKIIKK